MQWNAGGLARKTGELEERLKSQLIDICLIQETKLRQKDRTPHFPGYSTLRQDRVGGIGGGLLTLIRHEISFERLPGDQKDGTEVIRCRIKFARNRWATLANVYCPPDNSLGGSTTLLRTDILPTDEYSIIAGDLNAHSSLWDPSQPDDQRGGAIEDLIIEEGLTLLNDGRPTRVNPATGTESSPDVTLVGKKWADRADWYPDQDLGSDHLPIIFNIRSNLALQQKISRPPKWRANVDLSSFTAELENEFLDLEEEPNIHRRVRRFQEKVIKAAEKHVGKTVPGKRRKGTMNPRVRDAVTKRNSLRENVKDHREEWIEACHNAANLMDEAKLDRWEETLAGAEMQDPQLWRLVRSLNGCPDTNNPNEALLHNGRLITNNKRKADIFASHYAKVSSLNISGPERRETTLKLNRILEEEPPGEDEEAPASSPFTMKELKTAIKKCKKKGAPGPDDITPAFIKALGSNALEELLAIFNQSLHSNNLPQIWRTASIIPLLKAGKPAKVLSSYRPISLTSCVVKTAERMIADRIYHLAETEGWFHRLQAGFRRGRCCEDQVLRLVQSIDDGFQSKPANRTVMALLDLSKAYDKVWRDKLLLIMYNKGVPKTLIRWLRCFLNNRLARVNYNNSHSSIRILRQGLPQGSVLAPLLFLFYINTLAERLPEGTHSLFADDVTVTGTGTTLEKAARGCQRAVETVVDWCREYKMVLSDKSVSTFFTTSSNEAHWRPSLKAGEINLSYDPTPRLLGVILDRQLTFGPHVKSLKEKINSKCRILAALSNTTWGWRKNSLLKVYNTHIRSILDYSASAWQPWISDTNRKALDTLQNKALRLITGQYRSTPLEALRLEAGVQSYTTQSKRLLLTASEKALRSPQDHPRRLAVEGAVAHRLARPSFRTRTEDLKSHLPATFENREELSYSTPPPWMEGSTLTIHQTLPGGVTKNTLPADDLRTLTLSTISEHKAEVTIYTDGSAEEGTSNGGSGMVVTTGPPENPTIIDTIKTRGRPHTSSFEEELEAMRTACSWLHSHPQYWRVLVCTDSKSLCDSMASTNPTATIAGLLHSMGGCRADITIQWIPSHVDVPGNELADAAAKDATSLVTEDQGEKPVSFAAVKAHIRRVIKDEPVQHQRTAETYKNYNKDTDKDIKTRKDQVLIARLRSGHHNGFRAYQHRIDEAVSPECPYCPGQQQDLQHWMQDCSRTSGERMRLFGTTRTTIDLLSSDPGSSVELARRTLGPPRLQ